MDPISFSVDEEEEKWGSLAVWLKTNKGWKFPIQQELLNTVLDTWIIGDRHAAHGWIS